MQLIAEGEPYRARANAQVDTGLEGPVQAKLQQLRREGNFAAASAVEEQLHVANVLVLQAVLGALEELK